MSEKSEKNRDFQSEIHAQQILVNQLNERLTFEIPSELESARKELFCAECPDQIQQNFQKLAEAENAQKTLILMIRQGEIKLRKLTLEAAAVEAEKARSGYEAALAELPAAQAVLDAAQTTFAELSERIHRAEGRAVDSERAQRRAEQGLAQLETAPLNI